jgi:hypothetical protein
MCVDLFAPGGSITIAFLHERIYFVVDHDYLIAYECCDAFLKNDGFQDIDCLRIQFPHYIDWSTDPRKPQQIQIAEWPIAMEPPSWYGAFRVGPREGIIEHDPESTNPNEMKKPYTGIFLQGTLKLPDGIENEEHYLKDMKTIKKTALDYSLEQPIRPGETGFLRLEAKPKSWPGDTMVPLSEHSPFGGSDEFLARFTIKSPRLLRSDIQVGLGSNSWLIEPLIRRGWLRAGTLTRIENHRVSLVFPHTVQLSQLTSSTDPRPVFFLEPYPIGPGDDDHEPRISRFGQTVLTGASLNVDSDIVRMAERIRHYIETLPDQPWRPGAVPPPGFRQRGPSPRSMFDLVSKFGGSKQEYVGTFLRHMVLKGLLTEVTPANSETHFQDAENPQQDQQSVSKEDARVYVPVTRGWERNLLKLRALYTLDEESGGDLPETARYLKGFFDLHPFHLSLTMRWCALSAAQIVARKRLLQLSASEPVSYTFSHPTLAPFPRRALIVICSYCRRKGFDSYPELLDIGRRLAATLTSIGQFQVAILENPTSGDAIIEAIAGELGGLKGKGLFLFWYLGHGAESNSVLGELELYHAASEYQGLRLRLLVDQLRHDSAITKALILNCCHSGLAMGMNLSPKTFIWTVCNGEDTTPVIKGIEGAHMSKCFTSVFNDLLLEGVSAERGQSERDPLDLVKLLGRAQRLLLPDAIDHDHKVDNVHADSLSQFAHNLIRFDVLPPTLRDAMIAQVLAGQVKSL